MEIKDFIGNWRDEMPKYSLLLGNLSVEEMEKRLGVAFSEELKEYMTPRYQRLAGSVKAGQWHCFDLPFVLLCGDMDVAVKINNFLQPLAGDFKEALSICLDGGGR